MAKLRRMLGSVTSSESVALMNLIETQSKETIATWSINYAKAHWLPIYESLNEEDLRLSEALHASTQYLNKTRSLKDAKKAIKEAQVAAREAADNPVALAAARAVATASSTITTPTSSLGMAFYGAAAVAYHKYGLNESADFYDTIATEEFNRLYASLNEVAVENEDNPAKLKWNC